jgi:GMP synthase-like glutamine amidotransferase
MRSIIVIQHEPSVPPGLITEVMERLGVDHIVIEVWRTEEWPAIDEIGGLVVMGGVMNVDEIDAYPFLGRSRALMADALENEVPTLGVCLGSQMMARVLGEDVFRAEPRNAFFSPVELTPSGADDPVFRSFAGGLPVLQFHEDTFKVPDGAVALASSETSGLAQAFRYGTNAYAVQFHFEVDHHILRAWCEDIGEPAMTDEWGIATESLLAEAEAHMAGQRNAGAALTHRFLEVGGLV